MIVVIDTNVWISALFFGGKPTKVIVQALTDHIVAICPELVQEIKDVVARKFSQRTTLLEADLAQLLTRAL